jgi:hypothetical protein
MASERHPVPGGFSTDCRKRSSCSSATSLPLNRLRYRDFAGVSRTETERRGTVRSVCACRFACRREGSRGAGDARPADRIAASRPGERALKCGSVSMGRYADAGTARPARMTIPPGVFRPSATVRRFDRTSGGA